MLRHWLQLFRAQTMPATLLLILVPYLTNASLLSLDTLTVCTFAVLVHYISFGHNSLMDTAMGYDLKDPSKSHHPLVTSKIKLSVAHNVIHWGLCLLAVLAILISLTLSPNPTLALVSIFLWFVFGYAYNSGLSKECLLSFLPIAICFTAMGAWGWFLSHEELNTTGWIYLAYIFSTILFQISWSGHLKELELEERSNILVKMGAKVEQGRFIPRKSRFYGCLVKAINLFFAALLWLQSSVVVSLVIFVLFSIGIIAMLHQLTKARIYNRPKELLKMSIMEILTIYLPLPLLLDAPTAMVLMLFGVIYFFMVNRFLWRAPYPKV